MQKSTSSLYSRGSSYPASRQYRRGSFRSSWRLTTFLFVSLFILSVRSKLTIRCVNTARNDSIPFVINATCVHYSNYYGKKLNVIEETVIKSPTETLCRGLPGNDFEGKAVIEIPRSVKPLSLFHVIEACKEFFQKTITERILGLFDANKRAKVSVYARFRKSAVPGQPSYSKYHIGEQAQYENYSFPILQCSVFELSRIQSLAVHMVNSNENCTIKGHLDKNEWEEMYDSSYYFLTFSLLIPFLYFILAVHSFVDIYRFLKWGGVLVSPEVSCLSITIVVSVLLMVNFLGSGNYARAFNFELQNLMLPGFRGSLLFGNFMMYLLWHDRRILFVKHVNSFGAELPQKSSFYTRWGSLIVFFACMSICVDIYVAVATVLMLPGVEIITGALLLFLSVILAFTFFYEANEFRAMKGTLVRKNTSSFRESKAYHNLSHTVNWLFTAAVFIIFDMVPIFAIVMKGLETPLGWYTTHLVFNGTRILVSTAQIRFCSKLINQNKKTRIQENN